MKNKLEVIDDFVYDGVLLDEGDNFHPATTMRAKERVHFMDLADHFGPTSGGYIGFPRSKYFSTTSCTIGRKYPYSFSNRCSFSSKNLSK